MSLNCKTGDLARVIRSAHDNYGKIVHCVRLHASTKIDLDGVPLEVDNGPRWVIDPPLTCRMQDGSPSPMFTCSDAALRPIRNQPGADETLTWAGKPNESPADVIRELASRPQVEFAR